MDQDEEPTEAEGNWTPEEDEAGAGRVPDTPEDARVRRHRRIGLGIAVAAVACGLGVAVAAGLARGGTSSEPAAGSAQEQPARQAADDADGDVTSADVEAIAKTGLGYAGTDVSAGEGADITVEANSGHVLVTQRSGDGAEARVEAAAKRSAALMSYLSGRSVEGTQVTDVTWVMADADGAPRVAARNTPASRSTAAAADPSADSSMEVAVEGCDGWSMDDETHQGLGDGTSVPQSGGTAPTAPDGTAILAPGDADGATEESGGDPAADAGANTADGSASGQGSRDETASDGSPSGGSASGPSSPSSLPASGPSSSGSPTSGTQQTHTHDWEPVYQSVWVQDSAAWDEPTYSTVVKYRCSTCGKLFDSVLEWSNHDIDAHGSTSSYSTVSEKVQTGTKHHDATGHYEQQVTGYRCAGCGATK